VRADALWTLGDIVGYNAEPKACLDLVRKEADIVLLGNHDRAVLTGAIEAFNPLAQAGVLFSQAQLNDNDRAYLRSLRPFSSAKAASPGAPQSAASAESASVSPVARPPPGVLLCHGSPQDPLWEYLDEPSARNFIAFAPLPALLAVGHTHSPYLLYHSENRTRAPGPVFPSDLRRETAPKGALPSAVINVGSVGQPRDGDWRACFATWDTESGAIEFHRVQYDWQAEVAAIRKAGLPDALGERLRSGR
jgi:diadenosine tetraphosphatase ApaH/serine/threonine PP2A family protein phosphatase